MSTSTKSAIAQSLKKLAVDNHLNKITIKDITDDCSINRQTFYYHFHDIYDLVEWIYTGEASKVLGKKKTYDTWQQGFLHIFTYVNENRIFVLRTFHSFNRETLMQYLYNATYDLLIDVVNEKSQNYSVREEEKSFIANFYKYGFVGLMIDWINGGMKESPKTIIDRLNTLISGDIEKALSRFSTSGPRLTRKC
jgi:probable dihydroxyacetone kinase regulator